MGVPRDSGVRAEDVGSVQVEDSGAGQRIGHVDDHVGQGAAGVHGEGERAVGLCAIDLRAVQIDAGHAPAVVRRYGEGDVVGAAAAHRGGLGAHRGVDLPVSAGGNCRRDDRLRIDGDGDAVRARGTVAQRAGHRVGGRGGRCHRDDLRGQVAGCPQVAVVAHTRERDALACADLRGGSVHTRHERQDRITVVHVVRIHLEGVAQEGDDAVGLHDGLRHRGAVAAVMRGRERALGVAVVARAVVGGDGARLVVVVVDGTGEVAVREGLVLAVAAQTAGIEARHGAGGAAVLHVGAVGVRVVGTHDNADVVVVRRRACAGRRAHHVGVDHQTVTDVDGTAAAGHAHKAAHHAARLHRGIVHHQGVNRAGVLDTAEKTRMEVVGLVAVEVVDTVAVSVERALEAVAAACALRCGGFRTSDGRPVVGGGAGAVQPKVGRQVQRHPVEGGAAVHQLCHTR